MKSYLLYVLGIIALVAALAICLQYQLPFTTFAVGVMLLLLCLSLYGRISRLRFAYSETGQENAALHQRLSEVERQLQYLRQLTENVDTALFVCSIDGRIDWMNHAGKTIISQLSRQRESTEPADCLPPSILAAIARHEEVVDGCALSTVLLRIDGQRRLIVAMKDVSLLMQRQEMEAWQQLIRVLTHEIMNSLTPIISICEILAAPASVRRTTDAEDDKVFAKSVEHAVTSEADKEASLAVINRRCHSLLAFVESYRQLTRIKAPERTVFPVCELYEDLKILFPQIKTEGDGVIFADRTQIEQVIINLIKNALESGATEVVINSLPDNTLTVCDNGSGMTPDILAHAFIPFFTTKHAGTGIGLCLCRQILLKHGGTISATSNPGHGTTFTVTLPRS